MLSPVCTDVIPQCTEYPPQYWSYPPLYWCYPPLYWCYPPLYWTTSTVLKVSPHSTEAIPHMYCCYPLYWRYPSTVLKLSPHCTDVIPPIDWTTSNVLNNLHSTEPTLYGVPNMAWHSYCLTACPVKKNDAICTSNRMGNRYVRACLRVPWDANEAEMSLSPVIFC